MVARSRGPCYDISDLVRDCSVPGKVMARKSARETAKKYGLDTQAKLIDFVSCGVFEDMQYDNTEELDHEPDVGTTFDAYTFRIGPKTVYFAFYRRAAGTWIIKSFHPPEKGCMAPTLSYSPFGALEVLKK